MKGLPIVISAPSGGGKSTIAVEILKKSPTLTRSISCTTRSPRPGEKEGVDYFFLSDSDFKQKVKAGEFLEWAKVHLHSYGTPISAFEKELKKGKDVLLTIDPQGAAAVRKIYPEGIFIFVVPPTWELLVKRLKTRGSDSDESLEVRLKNAKKELGMLSSYDYLVVNDDLQEAVADVVSIIRAERLRSKRLEKKEIPIFND